MLPVSFQQMAIPPLSRYSQIVRRQAKHPYQIRQLAPGPAITLRATLRASHYTPGYAPGQPFVCGKTATAEAVSTPGRPR